jgi:hypothetical protein
MYIDSADKAAYGVHGLMIYSDGVGSGFADGWHTMVDEYENNGGDDPNNRTPIGFAPLNSIDTWPVLQPTGLTNQALAHRKTKQGTTGYYYESGGLADFTGPAWLDGTPKKPEYVLNAE